jgi:methyltransferase family protein
MTEATARTSRWRSFAPDMGMLVFHQRAARRRARAAAVAEALALLGDLEPSAPAGGPLSERGGVFWVELPDRHLVAATARLPRLGYTTAVDRLVPAAGPPDVRWRRRPWRLLRLWTEDAAGHRELAPDRRVFLFEAGGGPARPVRGYRGDGDPLGRRGLPVCDARLLVNLVAPAGPGRLLDPFAGVGGVALAAAEAGWATVTADLDPGLRHGLGGIGAHLVADARALPLRAGSVDAVATEPPYDRGVGPLGGQALAEAHRLLRPGGAAAVLCAEWQADGLRAAAAGLGWTAVLDCPVDRKGLAVVALAWRRP